LGRLRPIAEKFGLGGFVDSTIDANIRKECVATTHEVELLSRACDDERVSRVDVAKILDKSYRYCNENGIFDKIKKLSHTGIYSKVSALLHEAEPDTTTSRRRKIKRKEWTIV
jgi:acylphosphatase